EQILRFSNSYLSLEDLLLYRAFWIKIYSKKIEILGAPCNVGRDTFCIMPNADVYPCRRFILKLGNLLKNSLEEIVDNDLLRSIIEGGKRGRCSDCDIKGCYGCFALSYLISGDWNTEDIQCWYRR
ncbi:MAG: SPASM domain-containing protein, partial [Candidatus Omnitrophica bacterium]|nr:SPASM domain-containing protein [Candidatus Omnitrophota bacterium]